MTRIEAEDQVLGSPDENRDFVPGQGTLNDPYLVNAMDDTIVELARIAAHRKEPVYCQFEASYFRVNPDGTFERSIGMPPLRDDIEDIFKQTLAKVRATGA